MRRVPSQLRNMRQKIALAGGVGWRHRIGDRTGNTLAVNRNLPQLCMNVPSLHIIIIFLFCS